MKRIAVVVEGRTEESFVNKILQGELANTNLKAILTNPGTGGGAFSLPYMLKHIKPLLHQGFACITTMVDLHRFRNPGRKNSAEDIERELADAVNAVKEKSRKKTMFLPYVQKHEFEALLFADRQAISGHLQLNAGQYKKLKNIKDNPEDINHNMPPSKRLCVIHPDYDKTINGIAIARRIGLPRIEEECPHFAGWLAELRRIAKQ